MSKTKETVIVHVNQLDALLSLPLQDMQTIIQAIRDYAFSPDKEVEIPRHLQFGWIFFRQAIDYDCKRYSETCQARKAAGIKSGEAKQAKAEQSEQIKQNHTNQTNNNNKHNNKPKNKHNTLSSVPGEELLTAQESTDIDTASAKIAALYPPCRPADPEKLREAVKQCLVKEMANGILTPAEILAQMVEGVASYAEQTANWEEKRFISDPIKFIREGLYKCDPAVWVRRKVPANSAPKFDSLKPETWTQL